MKQIVLFLLFLPLFTDGMNRPGIFSYRTKTLEERKKEQVEKATQELQELVKEAIYIDKALFEKIKKLLAQGASPNVQTLVELPWGRHPMTKGTLLYRAIQLGGSDYARGHDEEERLALIKELVKLLVEAGAKLDTARNSEGYKENPLRYAIEQNDAELVKLMLEKGADSNSKDFYNVFEYALANSMTDPEILALLIEYGADIGNNGKKALFHQFERYHLPNIKLIQLLLQKGVNPNEQNELGKTVLMYLAAWARINDSFTYQLLKGAQVLLEHGANPLIKDNEGNTAFDFAFDSRAVPMLRLLSEQPNFILPKSSNGQPLLIQVTRENAYSPQRGRLHSIISLIQFLLEKGANPQDVDEMNNNALMVAVAHNQVDIARLLIDHARRIIPAIFERGHIQTTSYLHTLPQDLKKLTTEYLKSDFYKFINHANDDGNTALIFAANNKNKNKEMVKLLLENGADLSIANKEGKTALDIAKSNGSAEIVKMLSDAQK